MVTLDVFNVKKEKISTIDLDDSVFAVPANDKLFYEIIKMQLSSKRAGTASTKTRGMVRGGGKKPWRQKGTGRARSGSSRSPLWIGGAVIFGPQPKDYSYKIPKKARKTALKSALSLKIKEKQLLILDSMDFEEPKTSKFYKLLSDFNVSKALIVDNSKNLNLYKSARNIKNVKFLPEEGINVFDLFKYDHLLTTVSTIRKIEGALKQ